MAVLAENRYGKSRVRLVKVTRQDGVHTVREWSVDLRIQGDYESCFRSGDNRDILPTDTMKNTVYALARTSAATGLEEFGTELVRHFMSNYPQAEAVEAGVEEKVWEHLLVDETGHPTAFQQQSSERSTAMVSETRDAHIKVESGIRSLVILKTANSAFTGYLKDGLTTLRESEDRLLGTDLSARWAYNSADVDFAAARQQVRQALLSCFAEHHSLSVQHTLFAMAEAVLHAVNNVDEITLTMPNKHCLLVDLGPFGLSNPNEIFVPTDEPHGYIEARVTREPR